MSEKTTDNKLPYTCTSAYDRNACKGCVCSTCYEQEFCDRCSSCENQSKRKERCNAYEGAGKGSGDKHSEADGAGR